jgi:ATP-binding cassette subfamily B (MDR/TAP) protein 1
VLVVTGATTARLTASMSSKETKAYAAAGTVAQETFSTFRTVAAFNGEARAKASYSAALGDSLRLGIRQKTVTGLGTGTGAQHG